MFYFLYAPIESADVPGSALSLLYQYISYAASVGSNRAFKLLGHTAIAICIKTSDAAM